MKISAYGKPRKSPLTSSGVAKGTKVVNQLLLEVDIQAANVSNKTLNEEEANAISTINAMNAINANLTNAINANNKNNNIDITSNNNRY